MSCAPRITEKKSTTPIHLETLLNKALKTLNLKASETAWLSATIAPYNSEETIIVIPEGVETKNGEEAYNTHIVIVNNKTGKLTHRYFESYKTNGWTSNAVFIDGITLDSISYPVNSKQHAIAVRVYFRNRSQPNPYNEEVISLFVKAKDSLQKVLDYHSVYESFGKVNGTTCTAEFDITKNKLSMSNTKTKGYYDILVTTTQSKRNFRLDKNNECNPVDSLVATKQSTLQFNGNEYK